MYPKNIWSKRKESSQNVISAKILCKIRVGPKSPFHFWAGLTHLVRHITTTTTTNDNKNNNNDDDNNIYTTELQWFSYHTLYCILCHWILLFTLITKFNWIRIISNTHYTHTIVYIIMYEWIATKVCARAHCAYYLRYDSLLNFPSLNRNRSIHAHHLQLLPQLPSLVVANINILVFICFTYDSFINWLDWKCIWRWRQHWHCVWIRLDAQLRRISILTEIRQYLHPVNN